MNQGIYNSSPRGPMRVSDNFRQLMHRLRIATHEHHKEDSVASATKLAERRADIVEYVGRIERNQKPNVYTSTMRDYQRQALNSIMGMQPLWYGVDFIDIDEATRFADFARYVKADLEWCALKPPLKVSPYSVEGIA